ncbi:HpcH/HpaI aldolase/citrate lyase family protein [Streptomyces sp. NPDC096311]|uniref:HpcH/HpaI aldolase/citrate lyase family protein n=1 Tax=Streptomyces sp. NPDC096311 TaxID=3366083 RepID=UPI0037F1603D
MRDLIATARTFLFVPGDRPDRFAKAAASGADIVILDLEDAVGPDSKDEAREHVRSWLARGNRAVVRVNGTGTPWYDDDITAVTDRDCAVMVPKAEDPAQLAALSRRLGATTGIIPLIETAMGVKQAMELCMVIPVVRPAFGSVDLAAQLGVDHRSHAALRYARSAVVLAAAAAGCDAPVDGVTTTLDDDGPLHADLAHAAELGFTGKLCIHPRQIDIAHRAFAPTDTETAWAHSVVESARAGSVTVHDGQMVDTPVVLRAQAIIARAQAE